MDKTVLQLYYLIMLCQLFYRADLNGVMQMGKIIGIDVGGSTTKIVGFNGKEMIHPLLVKASDQLASVYGAFGKFTDTYGISLSDIDKVMITGVGSTFLGDSLYSIETDHASEFACVGKGGLYLSGYEKAIIVSMGTGTSIVYAEKGKGVEYMGGTGVGGGTLMGLSKKLLGISDINSLIDVASEGDIENIDLRIRDITQKDIGLSSYMTAANFGKVSDMATKGDLALGIINMVFESVGMLAVFAARSKGVKDVILTGNLTRLPQAPSVAEIFCTMFNLNFVIPKNAEFATVIGAALSSGIC